MEISQLQIIYAFIVLYAIIESIFGGLVARKLGISPLLGIAAPVLLATIYAVSSYLAFTDNLELREPPGVYIGFAGIVVTIYVLPRGFRRILRPHLETFGLNQADIKSFIFEGISAYLVLKRVEWSASNESMFDLANTKWSQRYPIELGLSISFMLHAVPKLLAPAILGGAILAAANAPSFAITLFFVCGLFVGAIWIFSREPLITHLTIEKDHLKLSRPFRRDTIPFSRVTAFQGGNRVAIVYTTPPPKKSLSEIYSPIDFIPPRFTVSGFALADLLQRALAEGNAASVDDSKEHL